MKFSFTCFALASLLCAQSGIAQIVPAAPVAAPAGVAPSPDEAVVEVNGAKLTRAELDNQFRLMTRSYPPQVLDQIRPQATAQLVEQFVVQHLLITAAKADSLVTSDEEVEGEFAKISKSLPPEITLDQAFERNGTTRAKVADEIKLNLTIQKLVEKKRGTLPKPSDEDLAAYFESHKKEFATEASARARHILLKTEGVDKAAAKKQIDGIHAELTGGADFAELAGKHSDCPSSAKGGDLGEFGRGQMVPAFEEAVFKQDVNAVGPVVETRFGYHIIQVTERKGGVEPTFETAQDKIVESLSNAALDDVMQKVITELRTKADIKYAEAPAAPAFPQAPGAPKGAVTPAVPAPTPAP